MLLAVIDGARKRPSQTGERATCPVCDGEVLSRCGEINVWHWAHRAVTSCDPWMEAESEWHAHWKSLVPQAWIEVVIESGNIRRSTLHLPPEEFSWISERIMFFGWTSYIRSDPRVDLGFYFQSKL